MKSTLAAVFVLFAALPQAQSQDISDDQTLHFVLMAASSLPNESDADKLRSQSVILTIMEDRQAPDTRMLSKIANEYRAAYLAATTQADKDRALTRAKLQIEPRPRVRRPLYDYALAEKANMVFFETEPQPSNEPGAACVGGSGGLAPYCRDGCSGNRPCDKLCRLDDETCTTCGAFGVCCCLGDPPSDPPPPPPGGGGGGGGTMVGQPKGSIYRNVTIDDEGVLHATAVTDTAASCSCHTSIASISVTGPQGTRSASSGWGGATVQATLAYRLNFEDFPESGGEIEVASSHESFCPIRGIIFLQVSAPFRSAERVYPFAVRYYYARDLSDEEPHHDASIDVYWIDRCNGFCQREQKAFTHAPSEQQINPLHWGVAGGYGHKWLAHQGVRFYHRLGHICGGKMLGKDLPPPCVPGGP